MAAESIEEQVVGTQKILRCEWCVVFRVLFRKLYFTCSVGERRMRARRSSLIALGLDIGGANLKAVAVASDSTVKVVRVKSRYFPIWKAGREKLSGELRKLVGEVCPSGFDIAVIAMTAELSDAYWCKSEGVRHVIESTRQAIGESFLVANIHGGFYTPEEAEERPLEVAAANWPASAWLVGRKLPNAVLIDVGSTTTDIIPVENGVAAALGKTDPERLATGELVFTGALRTSVSAVAKWVPVKGRMTRTSPEYFAITADVHLILGHIAPSQYTCDTPDGRGKTREEALARLSRVPCADPEILEEWEIVRLARFIYEKQLQQITEAIIQVSSRSRHLASRDTPVVTCGVGRSFLAEPAARRAGYHKITPIEDLYGLHAAEATPAYALALMALEHKASYRQL